MSRKFELVKEYPTSPKLGTVLVKKPNGWYELKNSTSYANQADVIENNPEFWQEIIEKDIERLRHNLDCSGDNDWWYISQLDNWEETLKVHSNLDLEAMDKRFDEILRSFSKESIEDWINSRKKENKTDE